MITDTRNSDVQRRRLWTTVVIVLSLAFVGFFVGIRPPSETAATARQGESSWATAPLARSHSELSQKPWSTTVPPFEPSFEHPARPRGVDRTEARARALAERAEHRAFAGAPPTIPHPVGQSSAVECRACHERGARIGVTVAPPWSHQRYTMCTQCHVPERAPLAVQEPSSSQAATVSSAFVGLQRAPEPFRWAKGSPPQIPHQTFLRGRCLTCHGATGKVGLQTSHPERTSCQQCHAPSALLEQRASL